MIHSSDHANANFAQVPDVEFVLATADEPSVRLDQV